MTERRSISRVALISVLGGMTVLSVVLSLSSSATTVSSAEGMGKFGRVDDFLSGVVPDWPGWSRNYWTDRELWGNRGYIMGGPRERLMPEEAIEVGEAEEIAAILEIPSLPEPPMERIDLETARDKPSTHTVVKGECLWFIAGYDHIYGNPLQWPLIYKANQHKIKNPDLIYPGQTFIIPRD